MKTIVFYLNSGSEIFINEKSNKDIKKYIGDLSTIFSSTNICTIGFENSCVLIRPSNISAIKIEDSEIEETPDITTEDE